MTKSFIISFVAFALSLSVFIGVLSSGALNAETDCNNIDSSYISKHADLPFYSIVSKRKIGDICEVFLKIENDYLPAYVSDNFVIIGDMFTNKNHVTIKKLKKLREQDFLESKSLLDDVVAFSYTPKDAKTFIYYVTDPDCQYCEKAKIPLKDFADQNSVEIKVVFLPLPMHPGAKDKSIKALCGGMSYTDYVSNKYPNAICEKGKEKVVQSLKVAEKLKINGTPTFISSQGQTVTGFVPDKLKEVL